MTDMFLSKSEVESLSGRKSSRRQKAMLDSMGIDSIERPGSYPAVLRSHVEQMMGMKAMARKKKDVGPDWGMIA